MIKFRTSFGEKPRILSIDSSDFFDVINVTSSYIEIRFVFNLNLAVVGNSPLDYKKVVVSLKQLGIDSSEEVVISPPTDKKINSNPSIPALAKPLTRRNPVLTQEASFGNSTSHRPPSEIDVRSSKKLMSSYSIINNLERSRKQDKITSCTMYIANDILDYLNNPVETMDLFTPEFVSLEQGTRHTQDKIQRSSLLLDINKDFVSPLEFISGDEHSSSHFYKKFVDYFIHDAPAPPKDFIDNLTFYIPTKNFRFVSEIEFPCIIKLPIKYQRSDLEVQFELYKNNVPRAVELITANLNVSKHTDAYHTINDLPLIDSFTADADSQFVKRYNYSFSYNDSDKEKIKTFNVYLKNLSNTNDKLRKYQLISSVDPQKISEVIALKLVEKNSDSLAVLRVVPVTDQGETSNFSDVVIGQGFSSNVLSSLSVVSRQFNTNIRVDLYNIVSSDILKVYKRRCKKSADSQFTLLQTYKRIKTNTFSLYDTNTIPGEVYEYYAVCENANGDIVQISNYSMCEFFHLSTNKSRGVSIQNLVSSGDSVSFSITTTHPIDADGSSTLYSNALRATYTASNTVELQRLNPNIEKTFQSLDPKEFKNLYFHQVTRVDLTNGESISFNLVSDGEFIDGQNTRRQNFIPRFTPGHTYQYIIHTFVRDPLTSKKDFIIAGELKNKVWFNRPYKWSNPKVVHTGILYSDDEKGIPEITNYENFSSEAVSIIISSEIKIPLNFSYEPIKPVAKKITRNTVKISWEITGKSNYYDSFVVVKVVNGKRHILGKTMKPFFYHKLSPEDLGTIYYEITCIHSDFTIGMTYYSEALLLTEDLSYKRPKLVQ